MHVHFLETFKEGLKKDVTESLEDSLESFFKLINDKSPLKNKLVHLETHFNQIKTDTLKGIISYDTRMLQTNRVLDGTLQLIDELTYPDLEAEYSEELKEAIESYNKEVQAASPGTIVPTQTSSTVEPSTSTSALEKAEAHKLVTNEQTATLINFAEFEIYMAEHDDLLRSFPRIYRRGREITMRRDLKGANQFSQVITPNLDKMHQAQTMFNPIRDAIKEIRKNADHQIFWLKYKTFNDLMSTLETGTIEQLSNQLPKLQALHDELKGLNLI